MGQAMPYHMHKGHTWQTIDRYLSTHDLDKRARRKAALLEALRDTTNYPRFSDVFNVVNPATYQPPGSPPNPVTSLLAHMNIDWFGLPSNGAGGWLPQPPFDAAHRTTGFWSNWYGDAERIVRDTTARAIEVSFGIKHGARVPGSNDRGVTDKALPRNWPIEFWWVCGERWFHASLQWRHTYDDERNGLVSVTWLTPGNGDPIFHDLDHPPLKNDGTFKLEPTECDKRFGSWIIGQPHNDLIPSKTWDGTLIGEWPSPVAVTHSHPEGTRGITVVQPSFPDGGVSNQLPEWNY